MKLYCNLLQFITLLLLCTLTKQVEISSFYEKLSRTKDSRNSINENLELYNRRERTLEQIKLYLESENKLVLHTEEERKKLGIDNETALGKCDACIAGIGLLHFLLSDKFWIETYKSIGQQICEVIPNDNLKQTCLSYVSVFLEPALTIMANAVKPEYICKSLRECQNSTRIKL
uniref:Saposin B domain-containing protein n=1 Tax=Schistosoma japonicum TaxID=6182 RepID=C1L9X6_SCHJA|nr:Saposin B domain-containing protein [Schistosoma japonicum]CAX71505.1 Saposin B domain-containing protein [Schistosoma japonicum]CAX71508.1 Saposin B domain-containing protein [Schistosoma japonicum]